MGDNMQYYKYILRNVAKRHNKTTSAKQAQNLLSCSAATNKEYFPAPAVSSPGDWRINTLIPSSYIMPIFLKKVSAEKAKIGGKCLRPW
jgi:hypothetical protein